ncbi:hypothetical protein SEA_FRANKENWEENIE_303 [Streptomyces phage Frankenweenie]|nr:hypothetical protein SEA_FRANKENWEENIE_303 [Streptomyces phage Frankenweenie]
MNEERMPERDPTDRSKPPRRHEMSSSDDAKHTRPLEKRKDGSKPHPQS